MPFLSAPGIGRAALLSCLALLTAGAAEADHESVYEAFYTTRLDTRTAYTISNLALRKDNMTLLLERGTVFLMQPIDGEVTGLAFIGRGVASMTPPNSTERFMLEKRSGSPTLDEPFSEAVFRFSDDTEDLIRKQGTPEMNGSSGGERAAEILRQRNDWLNGRRSLNLEARYLEIRLSNLRGFDFFLAELHSKNHGWMTYYHDPQSFHENGIFTTESLGTAKRRYYAPWTTWHKESDYGPQGHYLRNPDTDGERLFRIKHQEMDLNLRTTKTVQWEARFLIEPRVDGLRALRFDLANNGRGADWRDDTFHPVKVTSVTADDGRPLTYIHKKDTLLVILPNPVREGVPFTLVTAGTAEVIYQLTAESFGMLQVAWYPQYGFLGGRSSFRWTVRVPRPFLISGSGRVVREFEDRESNQNGIEISEDAPIHFPWIIFGRFQKAESEYARAAPATPLRMTIHSFPTMTVPISDQTILEQIGASHSFLLELKAPARKVDAFFEEAKEILKLYEKIYGPYPYSELHVAQMAPFLGFGQAPQGFVQLTGEAFMSQAQLESDFFHGFFAHEIAHQWWAHQIGWASPDDEWLSESFAEYASGIFVNEFQGPTRFQRTLKGWRERAMQSDQEAPIAAANSLSGPGSGRHRSNLLYNKGPYVLHMLRVQMDDDKYSKVMRQVQETYKNQDISTELLLREVNRITGSDYTYFFDQWFWDVGIPTFRYSWRSRPDGNGKHLVTVHISQDDKERLKRVLMPIYLHFKDKTIPRYQPVVDAEQDIRFLLDQQPKDVTLDDQRTLLAEIVRSR